MYRNVTKKFRYGGADIAGVYMDENQGVFAKPTAVKYLPSLASFPYGRR